MRRFFTILCLIIFFSCNVYAAVPLLTLLPIITKAVLALAAIGAVGATVYGTRVGAEVQEAELAATMELAREKLGLQKQTSMRDYLLARTKQLTEIPILKAQERRAARMGRIEYAAASEALADIRSRRTAIKGARQLFSLSGMAQLGKPVAEFPGFEQPAITTQPQPAEVI